MGDPLSVLQFVLAHGSTGPDTWPAPTFENIIADHMIKGDPLLYHIIETTNSAGVPLTRHGERLLFYWLTAWPDALMRRLGRLPPIRRP